MGTALVTRLLRLAGMDPRTGMPLFARWRAARGDG